MGLHWEEAFYSDISLKALGLPAKHNATLSGDEGKDESEDEPVEGLGRADDDFDPAHTIRDLIPEALCA
jgi:hypothetical protein